MSLNSPPHPLDQLSAEEITRASQIVLNARGKSAVVEFRSLFLEEPVKDELKAFLSAEHSGSLNASTRRPARRARVQYDVVTHWKKHTHIESIVDVTAGKETVYTEVDEVHQAILTAYVF